MVSTKSSHLFPDNSLKAFDGFYCTQKPVKFRWKHFSKDFGKDFSKAPPSLPIRLRLIHMYQVTDTNTTSDQWFYLHKNIILLAIILILKHILFRLTQKYVSPVMNCLVCCMSLYSFVSFAVRIVSVHVHIRLV